MTRRRVTLTQQVTIQTLAMRVMLLTTPPPTMKPPTMQLQTTQLLRMIQRQILRQVMRRQTRFQRTTALMRRTMEPGMTRLILVRPRAWTT